MPQLLSLPISTLGLTLADGTYQLSISDQLQGLTATTEEGFNRVSEPVTVESGEDDSDISFGYNNPGSIAGTIWSDSNGDQNQNGGEPGIAGVDVMLTPPAGVDLGNGPGVAITITTEPDGSYLFDGLPPGEYQVSIPTPPAGSTTLSIGVGEGVVDQDFGYQNNSLASLSGTVFLDTDKNGIEDSSEAGIEGVTIALIDAVSGEVIATTITDAQFSLV